jgi:CheY-like chemotaxis protein
MTRILVVDDEVSVCTVIQLLLVNAGYAVTAMTDGRAAVEAVASDDYAVALIDLNLGDFDGKEVVRAARKAKPDMPVVIMSGMALKSGSGAPESPEMSVDVHRWLAKPFKPKDLMQLLTEILAQIGA